MDSESNCDTVIHGERYGKYDAAQLERDIAKHEGKLKNLDAGAMMPPPAPVKMKGKFITNTSISLKQKITNSWLSFVPMQA